MSKITFETQYRRPVKILRGDPLEFLTLLYCVASFNSFISKMTQNDRFFLVKSQNPHVNLRIFGFLKKSFDYTVDCLLKNPFPRAINEILASGPPQLDFWPKMSAPYEKSQGPQTQT